MAGWLLLPQKAYAMEAAAMIAKDVAKAWEIAKAIMKDATTTKATITSTKRNHLFYRRICRIDIMRHIFFIYP